jgi:hypothetical protein
VARGRIGRHCERMRRGNGGRWVRRRRREVCDIVRSGELWMWWSMAQEKLAGKKFK